MDLTTQIANITNPTEFTHLCNIIFVAKWGMDYPDMEDDKDGGMDGYFASKKWLIARHCFVKKNKASQSVAILKKAQSDLLKAKKLRDEGTKIELWLFATPYKIPAAVQRQIRKIGDNLNLKVGFFGPSHFAKELLERSYLLKEFSFLHVHEIDETLKFIKEKLSSPLLKLDTEKILNSVREAGSPVAGSIISDEGPSKRPDSVLAKKSSSEDYKEILRLNELEGTKENWQKVKTIIYKSTDQEAVLQGVFALGAWYKFSRSKDEFDEYIDLLNIGIDTARTLGKLDAEAILLGEKAHVLSTRFCLLDLEGWGDIQISNMTGLALIDTPTKQKIVSQLTALNNEFSSLFKDAMEKAYTSKNGIAIIRVFNTVGTAAGSRAGHFKSLGIKDRASLEKQISKAAFMYAKNIAVKMGDDKQLAYTLFNFANMLGFVQETSEALDLLEEAMKIAKDKKMTDLIQREVTLKKALFQPPINLADKLAIV